MSFLTGNNFNEMVPYLLEKNEIALHLILCSSTRGFLSAACRRLLHLDSISSRATQFYELQQQQASAGGTNGNSSLRPALIMSYHKMQQYTSSSLIKVSEFDKLLWALGEDIRQVYRSTAAAQNGAAATKNQGQNQATDNAAKRFQAQCELTLLLANNPPANFQPLLRKFFNVNVRQFRTLADPAKLYFADYSILEGERDSRSLQEKRARHMHIDVFKRVELKPTNNTNVANGANGSNGTNAAGQPIIFPPHSVPSEFLRRCARCTSIMEDVTGSRPGYTFVLAQQRKCSCSGNWGLLPRSSFVG
jgi:mediator of RNA polymerase II transcription subunit 16, fungi type